MSGWSGKVFACALALSLGGAALAQEPPPDAPPPDDQQGGFSDAQIDQMLAPIALYPDPLLAQMMMAATYPFEIAQADRWLADNPGLAGDALEQALAQEPWDPSVKSLAAVPQILNWMATNPRWTEQLGEAFLAQGDQLMDHVQQLRQRAQARGALQSTTQQQVTDDGGYITIMPADPQTVYVPVYQPDVVYGGWWWPGFPPHAFAAPIGAAFVAGYFWGPPVFVGPALWGRPDWRGRRVIVNQPSYNAFVRMPNGRPARPPGPTWQFDPNHRRGAPYRTPDLRSRYGGYDPRHPGGPPPQMQPRPQFQPPSPPPQAPRPQPGGRFNEPPAPGGRFNEPRAPSGRLGMDRPLPQQSAPQNIPGRRPEAPAAVTQPPPAPRVAPQAPPRQVRPQAPQPQVQPQVQPQAQPQVQQPRPQQPQPQPQAQPQAQPRPAPQPGGQPRGGERGGERGNGQRPEQQPGH